MRKIKINWERVICNISILVMLWMGFSWFEVVTKNVRPNPEYNKMNFFQIMVENSNK